MKRHPSLTVCAPAILLLFLLPLLGFATGKPEAQKEGPVKFSVFVAEEGNWMIGAWGQDPVSQLIEKKTGVSLDVSGPTGDPYEKLNLMLSTGDIPDFVVCWQGHPLIRKMIDSGIAVSIDDLAEKYNAATLKRIFAEDEKLVYQFHRYKDGDFYNPQGKIYYLSNYQFSKKYYGVIARTEVGSAGYMVRKAVWEKMGKPSIETPELFLDVLRRIKNEGFKDNRSQPMIPITLRDKATQLEGVFGGSFGIYSMYYVARDSLTDPLVTHVVKHPGFLPAAKLANQLYREQLLEPETFTIKREQLMEKLANGTYFMHPGGWYWFRDQNAALQKVDPNDMMIAIPSMKAPGVQVPCGTPITPIGRNGWLAFLVTSKNKNPKKAIEFIDWLMTPEAQMLTAWGVPGQVYRDAGSGKLELVPEQKTEMEKDMMAFWKKTGLHVWYLTILMYYHRDGNPDLFVDSTSNIPKEQFINEDVIDRYRVFLPFSLTDLDPGPGDPLVSVKGNIDQIYNSYRPKLILAGSEAEVDAVYSQMVKEMDKEGLGRLEEYWSMRFAKINKLYKQGIKQLTWFHPTPGYGSGN